MHQILIKLLEEKNMINVIVPDAAYNTKMRAFLLSNTGEHLQNFFLKPGSNDIWIGKQKPGLYSLRVETENEVTVKQIFIAG